MFRDSFHIEPPSNEMNCDYDYLEVSLSSVPCTVLVLAFLCPDEVVFDNMKSLDFKKKSRL